MTDEPQHACRRCGQPVGFVRFSPEKWAKYCDPHQAEREARLVRARAAVMGGLVFVLISAGMFVLLGLGAALVTAGALLLLNITADVWLPALIARQGRRHGTEHSSRGR